MNISRRDFMKVVGISVASLSLTRCRFPPFATCYTPTPFTPTVPATARERLRLCWLSFGELAQATIDEFSRAAPPVEQAVPKTVIIGASPTPAPETSTENAFGQQLVSHHRQALEALVTAGELTPAVSDLVHEAYQAAVYHVWRSNAPITCYAPVIVNFAPVSANTLVQQAEVLNEVAGESNIDPATVERARTAIEHDMAFYALSDAEVKALYDQLIFDWESQQQFIPAFEAVDLEVTADARTATEFIINLLIGQ
jgi:hypothetical protein